MKNKITISSPKSLSWRCQWCFLHSSCSGESPAEEVAYQLIKCTIFLTDKFMILQFLWDFDLLQVINNQTLNNYRQFRWKTDLFQLFQHSSWMLHVFRVWKNIKPTEGSFSEELKACCPHLIYHTQDLNKNHSSMKKMRVSSIRKFT